VNEQLVTGREDIFFGAEFDASAGTNKLPDWAVVDVSTPPSSRWPGKVVAADFFNDKWELPK